MSASFAESGDSFAFSPKAKIKVLPPSSRWQATVHWTVAFVIFESHTAKKERHPDGCLSFLAESVRFELTVGFPITSFQD